MGTANRKIALKKKNVMYSIMAPKGEYFKDKDEAIAYYQTHEENLKDKPAWLIECIIDFARKYPNYKEYCEVETKVANGDKLTEKQAKKYGHLKWEKEMQQYEPGHIIDDAVDIHEKGEYDDIVNDRDAFEKYNKYGLDFPENLPPDDNIKFRLTTSEGTYEATAPVEDVERDRLAGGQKPDTWTITKVDKSIEN
jgi:hypothetical protein